MKATSFMFVGTHVGIYNILGCPFLYELVMVLREMNTTPTFRIYRNGVQQAALEAAFSADDWSIPLFRADFLPFTSKSVEHSRYLLSPVACRPGLRRESDDHARS